MKSKLLHDPCIKITYTYLVANAKKEGTSPSLSGAMFFLNLMHQGYGGNFGLNRDKTTANEMDLKLGDDVCEHDELKI
jgi:hypothetical protein